MINVKISTKKGDSGKTSLFYDKDIPKDDLIFDVLGNLDELSSFLGLAKQKTALFKDEVESIQKHIQNINGCIASRGKICFNNSFLDWIEEKEQNLENHVDVKEFVVFGKNEVESLFDISRAICRRAERFLVRFSKKEKFDENILKYINRLSDLLFVFALLERNQ